MKVLALGGSGGMGRFAVETSMDFSNVHDNRKSETGVNHSPR